MGIPLLHKTKLKRIKNGDASTIFKYKLLIITLLFLNFNVKVLYVNSMFLTVIII